VVLPLGICFAIQQTGTLEPIHIWLAILAGHVTRFMLSYLRFAQGRWRGISVGVGRSRETAAGQA
jgi:Na+-driven multidrug efflux pump